MVNDFWQSLEQPNQSRDQSEEQEVDELIESEPPEQELPEKEQFSWDNLQTPSTYQGEPDPTQDESWTDYAIRHMVSGASRAAEIGLGTRGNAEKFAKDVLSNFPKSGGVVGWAISELVGPETWERMVRGSGQILPTSENFKDASYKISGGYTKPKTKGEERFHAFVEDVSSVGNATRLPGISNQRAFTQQAINKVAIPAAANVAKNTIEDLGFGEDKAQIAKFAVWMPLSLANNVSASRYASSLMNEGRQIPNNVQVNVQNLNNRLNVLESTLNVSDPRTALARQQIGSIRNDIANGRISVQAAMNQYDGTNALRRSRGLFELGNSGDRRFASRALNDVNGILRDEIVDASHNFPQQIQSWQNGVGAWRTIHESQAISNFVEETANSKLGKSIIHGSGLSLFGANAYGFYANPALATAATVAAPLTYQTGRTLYRMWDNPTLASYYWNAVGAAQTKDAPLFIREYNKFQKKLDKEKD